MTKSSRALLIGVPNYRDDAIDDLPFIVDDMAELRDALSSVGYDVEVHDVEETDRDTIDSVIELFFQDAAQGETLFLYLSGHGIHHDGTDYLVPKGALVRSHDFRRRCLSLDFSGYVERSRAGDVAVFVDACREGIKIKEMGAVNAASWSQMQVARAGARHYSHVYACSPGERARYTTTGNGTFSIFSRALSTVVADETGPSTLIELKEQLQVATDALTAEHNCPRQQIRVRTETEIDDFVIIERPDRVTRSTMEGHNWITAAGNHPAWKQIGDGVGAEAMKQAAVALVTRLASYANDDEAVLSRDPWRPINFAERMTGRVGWLLSKVLNPEKLALSPAEAALLVVIPFLYVSIENRSAAEALGAEPENLSRVACPTDERASYEQHFNSYSRLIRRAASHAAQTGTDDQAAAIAWWLFRRWLIRKPSAFHEQLFATLVGPIDRLLENVQGSTDRQLVTELFEQDTISTLLRSLRASFDRTTIRQERQLAGSTEAEQYIRLQLLVVLLTVAHHLAINPAMLPDVIAEHLGISYSVDMTELHKTIEMARWDPRGRTRVLNAACQHPAVGLALQQQASSLDTLLGAVDVQAGTEPQLAPLQDLPVHATADQVHAATDSHGRPVYESTDLRFRLADERIQELLMGEQLYGDPALAIRELYQNALDACRYRGARMDYLRHQHPLLAKWSGHIAFTQGVDEHGRAFIECRDNGIGMGERELREVFSHAGMRFADLPEYLEEQAAWEKEGIKLYPNSRFGIGVLSYFMIADDVSVVTCRLDREGHPGRRLQVDIAGPGSLFYIRDLGRGHDAGTTVRLYLRTPDKAPSCVDLLRRLLWISEYSVTAEDATTRLAWEPHVLSPVAPLGARDPHLKSARRDSDIAVDATSRPEVWWTDTTGGVLADGVWVGVPLFGAVVNLSGQYSPQLTVDRRRVISYDAAYVSSLLQQGIGSLLQKGAKVYDHAWLSELTRDQPTLADAVAAAAVACGYTPWMVNGNELDITAAGCFPADADLINEEGLASRSGNPAAPRFVADWRVLAWAAAGMFPGVTVTDPGAMPLAQPTDDHLLCPENRRHPTDHAVMRSNRRRNGWLRPNQVVALGHVLWFAELTGRRPQDVAARLTEFGLQIPEDVILPETIEPDDLLIMSQNHDKEGPWLSAEEPVPLAHILAAADRTGRRPRDIAARLTEFGLQIPEDVILPETVEPDDRTILEWNLAGWADASEPVPMAYVLAAAANAGRTPEEVAARLTEFGLKVPEDVPLPETVKPDDLLILSRDFDGMGPWLHISKPVSLVHVLTAAGMTGRGPRAVAARLEELGLVTPEGVIFPQTVEPDDLGLITVDSATEWLDITEPVPMGHLLAVADETGRSPYEVAARLEELGYRMPEGVILPAIVERDDLLILSESLSREVPWLVPTQPVPMGHILAAATLTGRLPEEVAARLAELGHKMAEGAALPAKVERDDLLILSRDKDRAAPWLNPDEPVPLAHVLAAAEETGRHPEDVAARLAALGLRLLENIALPETVDPETLLLFRHLPPRECKWMDQETPVKLWDVLQAASLSRRPLIEVAQTLMKLGYPFDATVTYG
ncbi:wHTH domain-containing protein [Streptomyces sp. NPDC004012]